MEVVTVAAAHSHHEAVDRARRSRLRARLAQVDYLRDLTEATALGASQTEIARELRVTQPAISKALRGAATTPPVLEGFHGGSPYEIAERYAAGELTREQVVDELARWPYTPADPGDGVDWMTYDPGTFDDVVRARRDGLLDTETYDAVLESQDELGR
jgi:transcriptional regulator with XRE-family HTH domain